MTTLTQRIEKLSEDIQLLGSARVTQDQAEGFRTRDQELSELANMLMVPSKRLELFRQKPLNVLVPLREVTTLKLVIEELLSNYEEDPQSILNPDPAWRHRTKIQLENLAERINTSLMSAWREHIDETRPNVDQVPLHALQKSPAYAKKADQIRELLHRFEHLAQHLPVKVEDIEGPIELANQLRILTQDIPSDMPPSVRAFFESINQGTANADQLTEDVIQWLRANNLLATLRISWRQG